jgi:hypothetical protein
MVTGDAFRAGLVNLVHAGLREGAWATAVRLRCYALLAIAIYVAVAIGALAMSRNGIGHDGQPIGTDFASFWNAARLALAGEPLIPYDIQAFAKAQQEAMGPIPFYAFFYPPSFLLLLAPLGALPYLAALAAFLGLSFALVVYAASRIVPTRVALLTLAAAPAFFIALGHGQNAFLLAGLLGLGLVLLDRRPITAGLLIAAASIKPQLGLLIPVALLCGGYWRALIAAGLGTLGLAGLTGVAFGPEIWQAFLDQMPAASATMRDGLVPWGKMVTVYAALRVLDAGVARPRAGVRTAPLRDPDRRHPARGTGRARLRHVPAAAAGPVADGARQHSRLPPLGDQHRGGGLSAAVHRAAAGAQPRCAGRTAGAGGFRSDATPPLARIRRPVQRPPREALIIKKRPRQNGRRGERSKAARGGSIAAESDDVAPAPQWKPKTPPLTKP